MECQRDLILFFYSEKQCLFQECMKELDSKYFLQTKEISELEISEKDSVTFSLNFEKISFDFINHIFTLIIRVL